MVTIIEYPHPILNYRCKNLIKVDNFIREKVKEMQDLLSDKCIGLAANQVGLPYNFFITNIPSLSVVINPFITNLSKYGRTIDNESCMSIPNISVPVSRYNRVELLGYSLNGDEINVTLSDNDARLIQHEYDHCYYGQTILDITPDPNNKVKKFKKKLKEQFNATFNKKLWEQEIKLLEQERC